MTNSFRPCLSERPLTGGISAVARQTRAVLSNVGRLVPDFTRFLFEVYPSPPAHTIAENPKGGSGVPRIKPKSGSRNSRQFSVAISALLLSLGLLLGGVYAADAGNMVFTFTDDGTNSTIKPSGSLDLSDYSSDPDTTTIASSVVRLPGQHFGWWSIPSSRGAVTTKATYKFLQHRVSGRSTLSPKNGIWEYGLPTFVSDFQIQVRMSRDASNRPFARVNTIKSHLNDDGILDLSDKSATFSGTLLESMGDDDFHIEITIGDQLVIFTTVTTVPAKPEDLTADLGDSQVTLNWSNPNNSSIWNYQYQYKEAGGEYGEWTEIDPSDASTVTHTVTGLTNGTEYSFRIRAANFLGDGPAADEATATPLAPGAPDAADLTASAVKRTAVLTWTHDGDSSITKWQYQQREGDAAFGGEWKDISGSSAETRDYTVEGLTGGLAYGFRVRAVNDVGIGAPSNEATVNPPKGPTLDMERQAATMVLSEMGRATLTGATEIIDERLQSTPGTSTLMLGGQLIGGETSLKDPVASHKATGWWQGNQAPEGYSSSIEEEQLLDGSAFALSLSGEDAVDGNTGMTVWGRGDLRNFQGISGNDSWDGSVKSAWMGIDNWANERLLAGVAVSRNRGEVDLLTLDVNSRVETSLTAIWPYMQMTLPSGTGTVRVVLGIGSGEAEHRPEEGEDSKAGMSLKAASVGARWAVANQGQVTISVPVEAEVVQLRTRGDASTVIGGLSIKSWRVRSGVEFAHAGLALSDSGWVLLPRGSLSLRQDGGDGITGRGVEVGGGLGLYSPDSRMSLDASGHWLARHAAAGQREWGASIGVQFAPDSQGHGWSGSLRQEWGVQQEGILSDDTLFQNGTGGSVSAPGSLAARAGYGFGVMEGLMTVSADARLATGDEEVPHYGAGLEFALPRGLTATLKGEHVDMMDSDTRIGAGVHLRF